LTHTKNLILLNSDITLKVYFRAFNEASQRAPNIKYSVTKSQRSFAESEALGLRLISYIDSPFPVFLPVIEKLISLDKRPKFPNEINSNSFSVYIMYFC